MLDKALFLQHKRPESTKCCSSPWSGGRGDVNRHQGTCQPLHPWWQVRHTYPMREAYLEHGSALSQDAKQSWLPPGPAGTV